MTGVAGARTASRGPCHWLCVPQFAAVPRLTVPAGSAAQATCTEYEKESLREATAGGCSGARSDYLSGLIYRPCTAGARRDMGFERGEKVWRFRSERGRTSRKPSGSSAGRCSGPASWPTCAASGTTKSPAQHAVARPRPPNAAWLATPDAVALATRPDISPGSRHIAFAGRVAFPCWLGSAADLRSVRQICARRSHVSDVYGTLEVS